MVNSRPYPWPYITYRLQHFCVKRLKIAIFEDTVMRKRPFIRSRSSKVIDFGTNQKRVCTFLLVIILVINNSCSHILHRFGDIWRLKGGKSPVLLTPPPLNAPAQGNPQNFGMKLALEKLEGGGYCTVKIV